MVDYEGLQFAAVAGLVLFWLRATIDMRKGALVEVLAVTAPIAIVGLIAWLDDPYIDMLALGDHLTPYVVFVFCSMPILVAARICERLLLREQPQLADMFRVITVTALGIFVVRQLEVELQVIALVAGACTIYVVGDYLALYFRRQFALAALGLVSWMALMLGSDMSSFNFQPTIHIMFAAPAILIMPSVLQALFDRWGRFEWLGARVQSLRMRLVRPSDGIYHRTLFRIWRFRPGVCYLNHGSFGAVPLRVQTVQRRWQEHCMAEPMDVLARETELQWQSCRDRLARWLGAARENMALSQNATEAMNEIAAWFPLAAGDEVLLTDHEYGAVKRIWQRRAAKSHAVAKFVTLPMPFDDPQQIVDAILAACSERTRIVIFSHITSPTAVILPVAEICRGLRNKNIASCVDGPHALLQERVRLSEMDCDFYTASCHKWLCAPLGSGLLYVHPRWEEYIEPMRLSWGRLPPGRPQHWTDELTWIGTRDYSPYMAIPAAISFFESFDQRLLDARNHALACYARRVLSDLLRTAPLTPDSREWMGWMTAVWLPPGDHSTLQQRLWEQYRIEVPIMHFAERYLVRVSCHLYNTTHDIDRLALALQHQLRKHPS